MATGAGTGFVAIDNHRHTLFAVNSGDDTLSAINTARCTGAHTAGCPNLAPAQQAGANQGPGYAQFPDQLALMPRTGSAYLVNVGGSNVMAVADVSGCDAINTSACRHDAPSVSHEHGFLAAIDPATNTIYASSTTARDIDVLNALTCRAGQLSGCAPVAEIPIGAPRAAVGAIDDVTHTLYASAGSSVSVINTATCNAAITTGCSAQAPTIPIGTGAGIPALNPTTQTLYVAFGKTGNSVAAINAGTCNAQTTSGCGTTHGVVNVAAGTNQLAVSTATNTIYAPSAGANFSGDTVAVINGATCDAADLSGCGQPAATVKVGAGPDGVAVNDLTHTIYVANNADGDAPGTVSVINGATCNGATTTRCAPIATVAVGRAPRSGRDRHHHRPGLRHQLRQRDGLHHRRIDLQRRQHHRMLPAGRRPSGRFLNPSGSPSTTTPTPSTRSPISALDPPRPSSQGRSRNAAKNNKNQVSQALRGWATKIRAGNHRSAGDRSVEPNPHSVARTSDQPRRPRPGARRVERRRSCGAVRARVRAGRLGSGGHRAIRTCGRSGHAHDLRGERL